MNDFTFWFKEGTHHILNIEALDHILYIVVLAIAFTLKQWKKVLLLITAFTLGHSVTLYLTSLQYIDIKTNWVEFFIPITIAVTAFTNMLQKEAQPSNIVIKYLLALFFGFIHGMAYGANSIGSLYSGNEAIRLIFAFNIGVELAQIIIVGITLTLSYFIIYILKVNKNYWKISLSSIILVYAVYLAIKNLP
jgi:HupE / UreJ protein